MFSLRLKHEGSKALMKDYQKTALLKLLEQTEPIGTAKMWELIQEELGIDSVSRASVIFFLQDLSKYGYAEETTGTGKGGNRRLYQIILSKEELITKITTDLNIKLIQAFENIFSNN
jgi:hypothetical protein